MKVAWEGALGLVVRKTVTLLIVLLLVLTIEFLFFRAGVGEEYYIPKGAAPQQAESIKETLHLDESIVVQYFYFIGDMLTGKGSFDLYSYTAHRTVADAIGDSFWRTLLLFGVALVLSLLIGFVCAYLIWRMRSRAGRAAGHAVLLVVWTVPVILVALLFLLQVVFRFSVEWAFQHIVDYASMNQLERLLFHIQLRAFPILILMICSFGGFALMALQGFWRTAFTQPRAGDVASLKKPSFSESTVSVMPNMKLNIAFLMSCILIVEVVWMLDGLGRWALGGLFNIDMAIVEASVFLILLIVLISGFVLDLSSSLLALRRSRAGAVAVRVPLEKESNEPLTRIAGDPPSAHLLGELRWFLSELKRSVPGIVGVGMLIVMVVLALVGPIVAESPDTGWQYSEIDAVDQFLLAARDPFLYALAVLAMSFVVGFCAGLLTLPLGKFNYPVVLVAETLIVFPVVGMFLVVTSTQSWENVDNPFWRLVFSVVLVTWAPVALVVLGRAKAVSSAWEAQSRKETGLARYAGFLKVGTRMTMPDAMAALKYVAVIGSLSILAIQSVSLSTGATWGGMIWHYMQYQLVMGDLEFQLWWILPLTGIVVTASGFYLFLQATQDILEKRARLPSEAPPTATSGP